ncbi:DUF748 domain-containing protein [Desulforhopalus singaporensis]|uniref:DUF748 domain-containing protein n=1 Tax=Desulforhopalus singaporensis TaxID=91360 RepID=UPI0015A2A649|nr:DUF748 domain-containing protein [Desulforhopalus singaporensis]
MAKPHEDAGPKPEVDKPRRKARKRVSPRRLSPVLQLKKKHFLWGLIPLSLVLLYSLIGFTGVAYYFTHIFPEKFKERTGYTLTLSEIHFNPFTFRFLTGPVSIHRNYAEPVVSIGSLDLKLKPLPLLRRDMICSSVTIDAPVVNITRNLNRTYNIENIFRTIPERSDKESGDMMGFSELPFYFSLNNIAITGGKAQFTDIPAGKKHLVENIELKLPTFSNIPFQAKKYIRPYFSATINGSPVELTGHALAGYGEGGNQPTQLSSDIKKLDLSSYVSYLPIDLPLEISGGFADGKIDLYFDPKEEKSNKLSLKLDLKLTGVKAQNKEETIKLAVPSMTVNGTFNPTTNALTLHKLIYQSPKITSRDSSYLTYLDALFPHKDKSEGEKIDVNVEANPFSLRLESVNLFDGTLEFIDGAREKTAADTWLNLQFQVKNFFYCENPKTATAGQADFRITGEHGEDGSILAYAGTIDPEQTVRGKLKLLNIPGGVLFHTLLSTTGREFKGLANLTGNLEIKRDKKQGTFNHQLADGYLSITDFIVKDGKKNLLTAPLITAGPIRMEDRELYLGKVVAKNSTTNYTIGTRPGVLKNLAGKELKYSSINYTGDLILHPPAQPDSEVIFSDFSLETTEVANPEKNRENIIISGTLGAIGKYEAKGTFSLNPFSAKLDTEFKKLQGRSTLALFSQSAFFDKLYTNFSGKGSLTLPGGSFSGDITLHKGWYELAKNNPIHWNELTINGLSYTDSPANLSMDHILANGIDYSWKMRKTSGDPITTAASAIREMTMMTSRDKKQGLPAAVAVEKIDVKGSTLKIEDSRMTPVWSETLSRLEGTVVTPASAGGEKSSSFSFTGLLDQSSFAMSGTSSLFAPAAKTSYSFKINDYPMASFHRQLQGAAGIDTSSGRLSLECSTEVDRDEISGSGEITFTDLYPQSAATSSGLALALLSDLDNKFTVPFSFSGSDKDRNTVLFEEIYAAVQTLLIKAELSPVLLAGDEFSELLDAGTILFEPGEFTLTKDDVKLLGRYTELLKKHPFVGLTLRGIPSQADRPAIERKLQRRESQRVREANEIHLKKYLQEKELFESGLGSKQSETAETGDIVEKDIPQKILSGFTPEKERKINVANSMLLDMATKRVTVVSEYFAPLSSLEFKRIQVELPKQPVTENDAGPPGVSITLRAVER